MAIPFIKYRGMAFAAFTLPQMAHPTIMWVDDTTTVLARREADPNKRSLSTGTPIFRGCYGSECHIRKSNTAPLGTPIPYDPQPQRRSMCTWGVVGSQTPRRARNGPYSAQESSHSPIPPIHGHRYSPPSEARGPPATSRPSRRRHGAKMKPRRMVPNAEIMVLKAKVPPKPYATPSVYRPTVTIQQANVIVHCRKHPTMPTRRRCGDLE